MQIPPEKIEEILERVDLVALIGRHVKLRRSGRSYQGLCPFHGEKTPSFNVNPERRFFKCFGCGAGGDAISFVQRISGQSFVEVVHALAREVGVDLEERTDPAAELRRRLIEVSALAQRHFENLLWSDPRAQAGRDYLARRGVSEAMARRFGLGYALNDWSSLADVVAREGMSDFAAQVWLVSPRKSGQGFYDFFRGRLMVPIRSPEGRTIAFGARLVESMPGRDSGPKYLNSRESPLYRKAETLYALDQAREEIRRRKTAVLVEGYFDVIGLYGAGIQNAVALCSTALTAGHLAALDRFGAQNLVLLLDGDAAGLHAVERLATPLLSSGKSVRVATLPEGEDPDTFALREGQAGVEALLERARPLSTHLLNTLLPNQRAHALEEKMAAIAQLRGLLDALPAGLAKSLLLSEIAGHVGVSEDELRAHLRAEPARHRQERARPEASQKSAPPPGLEPHVDLFAALLIAEPQLREAPEARFADEVVAHPSLRQLLQSADPSGGLVELTPELRRPIEQRLAEIAATLPAPDQRRQALGDVTRKLRLASVERQLRDKREELASAWEHGADEEEIERIQEEDRQLNALRLRLQRRGGADGSLAHT